MKKTIKFDVTSWEPAVYDEVPDSATLSRATVRKSFSGDLEGESTAEGLFCQCADGSASYVGLERVAGKMGEREGTFVMQHGGIIKDGAPVNQFGDIIPGSGTGDFSGIGGTLRFQHDETGAFIHMDVDFE